MSSNPPPPITPNTNTNADFTPDDTTAPTVPVVTQASQLAHEFDLVSRPTQQSNCDRTQRLRLWHSLLCSSNIKIQSTRQVPSLTFDLTFEMDLGSR